MAQLWRAFGSVVPMFLVMALAVMTISYLIYRYKEENIKVAIGNSLLALSVLAILLVTLGTGPFGADSQRIYNLIPFVGTYEMIVHDAHPWILIRNIFLNILLFMPFGFFMRMCMSGRKRITMKVTFMGFLLSLCIEIAQYVLPMERWADVDDVILNTLGAFIGCILWNVLYKGFPAFLSLERNKSKQDTTGWLGENMN